jgi:hypothetical protein
MSNVRPGSYSVSVNFNLPWKKDKPANLIGEPKKRKKTLKPIIHPIFEKCASLTDDAYWVSVFNDCSRGKFPRGFSYKNNMLLHKKGNKITRVEIPNSISETFFTSKEFFRVSGGIMSSQDRKKMKEIEEEKLLEKESNKDYKWKDIKTEKLKEILINEFIKDISEKLNFNNDEKKELITTVKKGFLLKYFNSNNVIMSNFKIIEIEGLLFNEETEEYEIDPIYIHERKNKKGGTGLGIEKTDKKTDLNFLSIWEKYLDGLDNKKIKKVISYSSSYFRNESEESRTFENSYTS